jgi:NADH dehydrogenase
MDPTDGGHPQRLLITGASGYVGRRLVRAALARGLRVVAAVREGRNVAADAEVVVRRYDLTDAQGLSTLLEGVDGVIHLAAILTGETRPPGADEDLNVTGARRLLEAARRAGVRRFVFLSSQSAARDSPTDYGRSKWEIEQLLDGPGECAVRTGLVSGGPPRGLYGVLYRLSRRMPLLPIVHHAAPVYPVHVDDLCAGLLSLVEDRSEPPRLTRLAAAEPITIGNYVRRLARARFSRRVRLLPVPGRLILALSRATRILPFLPTVPAERVRGLMALRAMDPAIPRPPSAPATRDVFELLEEEGRTRRLLSEARTLMAYVLGAEPPPGALRRHVRAVRAEGEPGNLALPGPVRAFPWLLRLLEPLPDPRADRLRRRLALATRIVEMTPAAASVFHAYRARSRPVAWLGLAWLVAVEAVCLPFRWLAGRARPPF